MPDPTRSAGNQSSAADVTRHDGTTRGGSAQQPKRFGDYCCYGEGCERCRPDVHACHRCGACEAVQVSSGHPDHVWRWWCRNCLAANRRAYQEARNG